MPTYTAEKGQFSGLAERLSLLLKQLAGLSDRPDAVLLDARAGLHDIGSAAVTRLGASRCFFSGETITKAGKRIANCFGISPRRVAFRWA